MRSQIGALALMTLKLDNCQRVQLFNDAAEASSGKCRHSFYSTAYVCQHQRWQHIVNRYCPKCGEYLNADDN